MNYKFGLPVEIIFKCGAVKNINKVIKDNNFKKGILISSERFIKSEYGYEIIQLLNEYIENIHFGISANPTIEDVELTTKAIKDSNVDFVIALGGGSILDCAKISSCMAAMDTNIRYFLENKLEINKNIPVISIPTTAGTGSEVTAFSVITDEARNYKLTVFSYELIPSYALLDPELVMTSPASVAAACGVDALIHAWEAYTSRDASPFSDAMAEKAMELIGANLRRFVANRQDEEAAAAMLSGSMFAGIAFAWARLGNIHAMSHPVSAYFHVAHGVANAILLPTIVEYNALADHGRYEKIYNYISKEKDPVIDFVPEMLVDEARDLLRDLGIPQHLADVGVTEDKIELMAADAMKSGNIMANPRQSTIRDIIELYKKAM